MNELVVFPHMGKVDEAARLSGLSKYEIRRLVATGTVRSVRSGKRILVNLDSLAQYMTIGTPPPAANGAAFFRQFQNRKIIVSFQLIPDAVFLDGLFQFFHGLLLSALLLPSFSLIIAGPLCGKEGCQSCNFQRSWLRWRFLCHCSRSFTMVSSICRGV